MKIESKLLIDFVDEISMDGLLNECVIDFEENGVSVIALTTDNIAGIISKMSKNVFSSYESIGSIAIDNILLFRKFLERFSDGLVTITKEENLLRFKTENKEGEFILASTDFIKKPSKVPTFDYKTIIKIDSRIIKDAYKTAEIFEDHVNVIKISIKDNELTVSSGETSNIKERLKLDKNYNNTTVKVGEHLGKCIKFLDDEITLKLDSGFPVTIEKKSENKRLTYVVAPRTDDE